MEEQPSAGDLLQPAAPRLLGLRLALLPAAVRLVEDGQQVFGEGADSGDQALAEHHVPSELDLRVCGRRTGGERNRGSNLHSFINTA